MSDEIQTPPISTDDDNYNNKIVVINGDVPIDNIMSNGVHDSVNEEHNNDHPKSSTPVIPKIVPNMQMLTINENDDDNNNNDDSVVKSKPPGHSRKGSSISQVKKWRMCL